MNCKLRVSLFVVCEGCGDFGGMIVVSNFDYQHSGEVLANNNSNWHRPTGVVIPTCRPPKHPTKCASGSEVAINSRDCAMREMTGGQVPE